MAPKDPPPGNDEVPAGAFGKDKLYGNRLDQSFALHERFTLLGGKVDDTPIDTEIGEAYPARLIVQRLDENEHAQGRPFVVTTVASAIVEKIRALTPADVPATVELRMVESKRWKSKALVLQYVGGTDDLAELAAEFGIDPAELSRRAEAAAPEGERIPY